MKLQNLHIIFNIISCHDIFTPLKNCPLHIHPTQRQTLHYKPNTILDRDNFTTLQMQPLTISFHTTSNPCALNPSQFQPMTIAQHLSFNPLQFHPIQFLPGALQTHHTFVSKQFQPNKKRRPHIFVPKDFKPLPFKQTPNSDPENFTLVQLQLLRITSLTTSHP